MNQLYYYGSYFLLYAFLGWGLEVAYHVVSQGKVINRGFLNGPICPIYGFGMIVVLALLEPFSSNFLLLFLGGSCFATIIELFGGFVLYKLFHMRWWDYSDQPYNLGGFICLKFSLGWGFCIVFAVDMIHPLVKLNVSIMDGLIGHILFFLCYGFFVVDMVITVLSIMNLNKDLKRMNALAADMRRFSDDLTEKIGKKTFEMDARVQQGRLQASLARADMRDVLKEETEKIQRYRRDHAMLGYGRILRAFPDIRHTRYNEELCMIIQSFRHK